MRYERKIKKWLDRTGDPEARVLLLDLAELFMMDARLRETAVPPEEELRQRDSPKTLDTIIRFTPRVDLLLEKCREIPQIGFKALDYTREVAAKVCRWREDPDYELDNNFDEQSARTFASARKTSLFHCSHEGGGNDCVTVQGFLQRHTQCQDLLFQSVAWCLGHRLIIKVNPRLKSNRKTYGTIPDGFKILNFFLQGIIGIGQLQV